MGGVIRRALLIVTAVALLGVGIVVGVGFAGTVGAADSAPVCSEVEYQPNSSGYYEISTVSQLQCLEDHGLDENYVLTGDIDASATEEWNDGDGFEPIGDFAGTFDGANNTIADLYINRSDEDRVGLFATTTEDAEIRDLTLVDANVTGAGGVDDGVGGLVGFNEGDITDVSASGEVTGDSRRVGGLVGFSSGDISASSATVDVEGEGRLGGLIGENDDGAISESSATGDVTGDSSRVGGLVGWNVGGTIEESSATGDVSSDGSTVGGLVGWNTQEGELTNVAASGNSTGNDGVGGLIGSNSNGDIIDSAVNGNVTGNSRVGGLVGHNSGGEISESSVTGEITGDNRVGGLVGWNTQGGDITGSHVTGEITGSDDVGGLVGEHVSSTITDSSVTGTITGDGSGENVGGLLGRGADLTVVGSSATGTVVAEDAKNVGGLIGSNHRESPCCTVEQSYADVDVTGEENVGGLIGKNEDDLVTNTYAVGNVTGSSNVGGLVGHNTGEDASITQSYAAGNVSGDTTVGGLVGTNEEGATVEDAYWDTETTTQHDSAGGTGLTTAEMRGGAATDHMDGLDFSDTWAVETGAEISYPYLHSAAQDPPAGLVGVSSLSVSLEETELTQGETTNVTVTATYDDNTTATVTDLSSLTSSDSSVAEIASDGTVTTTGVGTVHFEAEYEDETATTATLTVTPDDAESVAVEIEPDTEQTAGETITGDGGSSPSAKVTDQFGNPVGVATVEVEVIDGPGSLTDASTTTSQTDSDGIATFSNLAINETGDYRLEFSIDSAAINVGESASVDSQTFTVGASDLDSLEITDVPDSATAGEEFTITINGTDVLGNVAANVTAEDVALTSEHTEDGTLVSASTLDLDEYGGATVDVALTNADESHTLTLDASNADGDSTDIDVGAAAADALEIVNDPVTISAGAASSVTVEVTDQFGNPAVNQTLETVTLTSEHDGAVSNESSREVDSNGQMPVFWGTDEITTADSAHTLTVDADGVSPDSTAIQVDAADPASIEFTSTLLSDQTAGEDLSNPVVEVTDTYGNPVLGVNVTGTANGPGELSDPKTRETGLAGTVHFSENQINTTGEYNLTIAVEDDPAINATSNDFTVVPAPLDSLHITSAPEEITAGDGFTLTINATDVLGNLGSDKELENLIVTSDLDGEVFEGGSLPLNESGYADLDIPEETVTASGTHTLTVDADGVSGDSVDIETEATGAHNVTLLDETYSVTAGEFLSLDVKVTDEYGNLWTETTQLNGTSEYDGEVHNVHTDIRDDGTTVLSFEGVTTADDNHMLTVDGNQITEGDSINGTVTAADPDLLTVETQPETTTAGESIEGPPTANLTDAFGNAISEENVTVTASGSGDLGGTTTLETDSSGFVAFDDLHIEQAEAYTLTFEVAANSSVSATSEEFTVEAGNAVSVSESSAPSDTVAGEELPSSLLAQVTDAFDNPVEGVTITVEAIEGSGSITSGDTTTETTFEGFAMLSGITIEEADAYRFEYSIDAADDSVDESDTAQTIPFLVLPDDAIDVAIDTQPTEAAAGENLVGPPTVTVTDEFANPVADVTVSVAAIDGAGSITAGEMMASTNSSGIATFDDLEIETADDYRLAFSIDDGDANVGSDATALTDSFTVESVAASSVAVETQPDGTQTAGEAITGPPRASVTDEFDNPVEDVTVSVDAIEGAGSITVGETAVETDAAGLATFDDLEIDVVDDYRLAFSIDDSDANVANADETQTDSFDVESADADAIAVETQPDSTQSAGGPITGPPEAIVTDEFDNPVEGVDMTVDAVDGTGAIVSPETTVETASDGLATFDELVIETADEYRLAFSIDAADEGVAAAETALTDAFTVEPAAVERVEIDPTNNQTITAGETVEFDAAALDAFGNENEAANTAFTWENTTTDGTFEHTVAGSYDVTATFENVTSDTVSITVEPAPVDTVEIDPASDRTITAGETVEFNATAYDEFGNKNETADTAFTWASTTASGTFVNTIAGTHEVTAELAGVESDPITIEVEPAAVETVELDPESDQVLTAGEQLELNATAYDAFGNQNETADTEFTWTNTTANGTFENTTAGAYGVTAELAGVEADTTTVTVQPATVIAVEISPASDRTITAGETVMFDATAYDVFGNENETADAAFDWTNVSAEGAFDQTTVGSYTVTAELDSVESNAVEITVEPAEAATLVADSVTAEAGVADSIAITAFDAFDNPVPGASVTVADADGLDGTAIEEPVETNITGVASVPFESHTPGTYTVGTELTSDDAISTTAAVTVEPSPVVELAAEFGVAELTTVESTTVTVTATYHNGTVADVTARTTFSTDDAGVATVSPTGTVDAYGAGTATVTAEYGDETATAVIDVEPVHVEDGYTWISSPSSTISLNETTTESTVALSGTESMTVTGLSMDLDLASQRELWVNVSSYTDDLTPGGSTETTPETEALLAPAAETFETETGTLSGGYVHLEYNVDPGEASNVTLAFSVDRAYLAELGVDSEELTLYRQGEDGWEPLSTDHVADTETDATFEAMADGLSVFSLGTGVPSTTVADTTLEAATISAGETATVTATVTNRGQYTAERSVDLVVDGEVVETQAVILDGSASEEISFAFEPDEPGAYELAIDGEDTQTLTVEPPQSDDDPTVADSWWLPLAALAAAGLTGGSVMWYRRRIAEAAG
ncbi:PGF-pre-PGF domain-containing protein [Halobacteria archaeon AArc-dxtr1]|nr:PGF-pre-PGF domain-containing protein [Halobacteria archaeon AArc-dxtr1]